jgi:hypothetical protein
MELSNEQLAQQLKKMKLEQQFKQNMIDSIIASDPEIQSMRKKIDLSYMNKERAKQLNEKQVRTLEEKTQESQQEAELISAAKRETQRREAQRLALLEKERNNQLSLQEQMEGRKELEKEARKEYEKERDIADREVQRLIEEERKKMEAEQ